MPPNGEQKPWEKYADQAGPWEAYGAAPDLRTGKGMEFPTGGRPEPKMRESALGKVRASYVEDPYAELKGAGMAASVLLPGEVLPLGRIASFLAPRVIGAAGGAWLGGSAAREFGIKPIYGAIPGAAAGAFLPELGQYSRLGRLGSVLGRVGQGGEEATGIEGGTLAERIRAEKEAGRLVKLPEELAAERRTAEAQEAVARGAHPRARAEGMIRAGRGERPQLTNEELDFLRRRK